jgi:peptidoglycan hydrolase-like protein with peptidoglycan-binding domain
MTFKLDWLADVLEAAGLKVAEVDGWRTRGRAEMGEIAGVLCHHTGGARTGNMPSLRVIVEGRADLPGPLSQLGLGRDGTWYVIAAGRCNHAGAGRWMDETRGNSAFIGVEAENTGRADDHWPDVQMDAYRRGVAAVLRRLGRSADWCVGHKEFALPLGRKPDPSFDMPTFRSAVAALLAGPVASPPALIPAVEPAPSPQAAAPRPTLRRGAKGDLVKWLQARVGVRADGDFGPGTEAAVRRFQRAHDMVPDGIVGPKSWRVLDAVPV